MSTDPDKPTQGVPLAQLATVDPGAPLADLEQLASWCANGSLTLGPTTRTVPTPSPGFAEAVLGSAGHDA